MPSTVAQCETLLLLFQQAGLEKRFRRYERWLGTCQAACSAMWHVPHLLKALLSDCVGEAALLITRALRASLGW